MSTNKYASLFNDSMRPNDILRILCTAFDNVPEDERDLFSEACLQAESEARRREDVKYAALKAQGYIVCTE